MIAAPVVLVLGLGWLLADRMSVTADRASLRQRVADLARDSARLDAMEHEVARLSRIAYLLENVAGTAGEDDTVRRYGLEASRLLGIEAVDSGEEFVSSNQTTSDDSVPHRWPVEGIVTADFDASHKAIDIAAARGTPVRAAGSGIVEEAGIDSLLGFFVVIRHPDGHVTTYGHNSHSVVVPGQTVHAGDVIGFVGSSGQATGPHLHYEVARNGQHLDPRLFLP